MTYLTDLDIRLNAHDGTSPHCHRIYRLQCKLLFARNDNEASLIQDQIREIEMSSVDSVDPEQAEYEQWQKEQEYEVLNEMYADDKANDLIGIIKKSGDHQSEVTTITPRQWAELTGLALPSRAAYTKDGKHIKWEYAFDQLAELYGYRDDEALYQGILDIKKLKTRIAELKRQL